MGFIPRIESLRGIAALTVVAAHVWGQFSDAPSAGWDAAVFHGLKGLSNGTGAVVGFFVISGFVLARSLEANADPSRYFRHRIWRQTAPVLMLECLCAACLVALIAWRSVALFRPLDLGVVRFYGKISYSFYLLHLLGILFANQALAAANFPLAALPASFAMITVLIASVLMTTPAAYLSWRYIEVPFINLGKSFKGYRLARG